MSDKRVWMLVGAIVAFIVLLAVARSCVNANRVHTPESWIREYVTAPEGPTFERNAFFDRLRRFDRKEAAAALVDAIGSDVEAYREKRFGLTMALARLGEPSALEGLLALHERLEEPDRTRLLFAIGASLTEENVKRLLDTCEEDDALLEGLATITGQDARSLDEWETYFRDEEDAIEAARSFCRDHAESAAGSR